jgi:hypothetical protein
LKRDQVQSVLNNDSKEKEQGIITESPIEKLMEVILLWKKTKTKFGLSIIPNIITEKWG